MEAVDTRAVTMSDTGVVTVSDTPVPLPEGLEQLTPEQVQAATDAVPEEISPEEQARMIQEAMAMAEAKENEIENALKAMGLGSFILIRMEHPGSLRHVITFSEPRPLDRAVIAVLNEITRQLETYEQRRYWVTADKQDEDDRKNASKIAHPDMNREARRALVGKGRHG